MAIAMTQYYKETVAPKMQKELGFANPHRVPRVTKIVVNMGLGEALNDKKILDSMGQQLALITGQKPLVTKARRAIATFKLRAGMPIGLKVTLRGVRMWAFLQKLITIVLPRVRDFRGVSDHGFDQVGNMNMGIDEMSIFPEVQYESLDKIRGMQVTIVTTAHNKKEGKMLMQELGMPFEKKS